MAERKKVREILIFQIAIIGQEKSLIHPPILPSQNHMARI